MTSVIVAATPFHGHVTPLLTAATDLAAHGHEVLFLTGARYAGRVRAAGLRFVPLDPEADFDDRDMDASFPGFADVPPGPGQHAFFWQRVFADAAGAQHRQLTALLTEFPAAVLVHDTIFLGALPFSLTDDPGRPLTVCLGVLPPMLTSADAPPFGLGVPFTADRDRIRALNTELLEVYADMQRDIEKTFAGLGVPLPGFIFDCAVTAPAHYLQLTVPAFEYPRTDAPASFRCAGALPPSAGGAYEPPGWWPELRAGRPVVVVTQGTLANDDLSELIVPAMRGLAGLDALVVVATARPDGPDEVRRLLPDRPDNARVEGYVPFDLLLPYADVLVTNGGYGGVHTALHHGVPLVVAGDTEDKAEVAARVAWSGVGVDVRTGRPGPERIGDAVRTVLTDAAYRRQARAMRDEFARHDPIRALAALVAGAAR
ncbi:MULTISPECIES: glycosyltransferase [Catenuloplanes]|uniref:UDP:flavonoid glycosyltransferase YjiC (YdhE family) n=1 Tax=Catenuloplanes niger TaxID=587534 RepID=A0AAE3ZXH2_9ACTN|nr:nucleotide disphospho-sugar-binding domain-containing protein [Catenuloplanes niger]MDR7326979.1 UDP:flavonoid glycosyltransferase YjiC (YdhE family) [Catenuloplanes niger]